MYYHPPIRDKKRITRGNSNYWREGGRGRDGNDRTSKGGGNDDKQLEGGHVEQE